MLTKELIKFANELDSKDMKSEADTIDLIVSSIKELMDSRGLLDSDSSSKEESEGDLGSNTSGEAKQVKAFGYSTQNFDICKSAVDFAKTLEDYLGKEPDGEHKDLFLEILEDMDDFFQIEKNAIKSDSLTERELDDACDLFLSISYNIGEVAGRLDKDLAKESRFLTGHIKKINSFSEKGD